MKTKIAKKAVVYPSHTRKAYVEGGYLKLWARGRPSNQFTYQDVTGEILQKLLDGGRVRA